MKLLNAFENTFLLLRLSKQANCTSYIQSFLLSSKLYFSLYFLCTHEMWHIKGYDESTGLSGEWELEKISYHADLV